MQRAAPGPMAAAETLPAQPLDAHPAGESPPWQNQVDRYRQECIYKVCEQTGLDQATVQTSPELRRPATFVRADEREQQFLLSPARLPPIHHGNLLYLIQVLEPPHQDVRYFHTGAPVDLRDKFVIKFGVTSDWKRRTQRLKRFEAHRKAYGPICVLDTLRVGDHNGAETVLKGALIDRGCLCTMRRRWRGTTDDELVAIDRKQAAYADLVGLVESAVRLHGDMPNALEYLEQGKRQRLDSPQPAAPVQRPAALPQREPDPVTHPLAQYFPHFPQFKEMDRSGGDGGPPPPE